MDAEFENTLYKDIDGNAWCLGTDSRVRNFKLQYGRTTVDMHFCTDVESNKLSDSVIAGRIKIDGIILSVIYNSKTYDCRAGVAGDGRIINKNNHNIIVYRKEWEAPQTEIYDSRVWVYAPELSPRLARIAADADEVSARLSTSVSARLALGAMLKLFRSYCF